MQDPNLTDWTVDKPAAEEAGPYRDVVFFVTGQLGLNPFKMTLQTEFRKDLTITEDECKAVVKAFARRFEVDISMFDTERYYGHRELHWFWGARYIGPQQLLEWLFRLGPSYEPLTLADFIEAAKQKRWPTKGEAETGIRGNESGIRVSPKDK